MEKKTNGNFISKENLDFIAEAFKNQESTSLSPTLDKNDTFKEHLFPTDKEGLIEFIQAQMQSLKEPVDDILHSEDDCKHLRLEDLDEW